MEKYQDTALTLLRFRGKASHIEFWRFVITIIIIMAITLTFDILLTAARIQKSFNITFTVSIFIWFPFISIIVRRLHDSNHSGKWLLLYFLPCILSVMAMFSVAGLSFSIGYWIFSYIIPLAGPLLVIIIGIIPNSDR